MSSTKRTTRNPSDLLSMAKAARTRLEAAIKDAQKQLLKAADASNAKAAVAKGRPRKQKNEVEVLFVKNESSLLKKIQSVVMKEDGSLASPLPMDAPVIVRMHTNELGKLADVQKSTLHPLEAKFKHEAARAEVGRSQKAVPKENHESINKLVTSLFPDGYLLPDDKTPDKMKQEILSPIGFIIVKGCVTSSAETAHLGTCRIGFGGSRQVVCMKTLALLEHLTTTGSKADLTKCYQWMKNATVTPAWKL